METGNKMNRIGICLSAVSVTNNTIQLGQVHRKKTYPGCDSGPSLGGHIW